MKIEKVIVQETLLFVSRVGEDALIMNREAVGHFLMALDSIHNYIFGEGSRSIEGHQIKSRLKDTLLGLISKIIF